jgi:hypothetical protein
VLDDQVPLSPMALRGIRTLDALLEARAIGVTRVGASHTAGILDECRQRLHAHAPSTEGSAS